MTKQLLFAALAALTMTAAHATGSPACEAQATDKKLSGAARTSFVKKCDKDAKQTCEAQAVDKKLHGAAKDSFTKKCVHDSTAAAK